MRVLTIFFLLLPVAAFAQKTYRIDEITNGGGYYLVEVVVDTVRGTVTEAPQRFNTPEQLTAYVAYLRDKAAKDRAESDAIRANARAEAKKAVEKADADAQKLLETVPSTNEMAAMIEAVGKEFFAPKPASPDPAPPGTPKKAKKKGKKK